MRPVVLQRRAAASACSFVLLSCALDRPTALPVSGAEPVERAVPDTSVLETPQPATRESAAPTDVERSAGLRWRFRAGAPVLAHPVVAADGATYVGTTAGHVHKLGLGGRFLWSFNVGGAVVGRLAIDPKGLVYAATANARLWALLEGGTALWVHRSHTVPVTSVAIGQRGELHFGGLDDHMHAIADNGSARWRAPLFSAISAGPAVGPGGSVVVATSDAQVVFVRGVLARRNVRVPHVVIEPPVVVRQNTYVVSGDQLIALDRQGDERWSRSGVRFAPTPAGDELVVVEKDALAWLDHDGVERSRAPTRGEVSASVAAMPGGAAFVPMRDGTVVVVRRPGVGPAPPVRRLRVGRAPVYSPVIDAERGRVLVASGDGVVAALDADDEP